MNKINILPKKVFSKISAGELIERPYSVVKELVENSIDAGAKEIVISIEKGGKQLIKVSDDGCGIERDDLKRAFMQHATSKISDFRDLETLSTLGFRGEGLASIAVVSRVLLTSVTGGNGAFAITCEDGICGEIKPAALEKGTEICVRDLFYNTPAREKFMKEDKKEEADITSFVSRFILGNPEISFRYYSDGKLVLQSYGGGLEEALAQVYGAKTVTQCLKIDATDNNIRISGYIGNQNFFKSNKSYQTIFLNGRYINNVAINTAIGNAYSVYAMKKQFPFYVLSVQMPASLFDVNAHPNKIDVRFLDSRLVFGTIYKIISSILDGTASAAHYVTGMPQVKSTFKEENNGRIREPLSFSQPFNKENHNSLNTTVAVPEKISLDTNGETKFYNPYEREPISAIFPVKDEEFTGVSSSEPLTFYEREQVIKEREHIKEEQQKIIYENCKYKGNVFNTYLIYEMKDTVYFIDQHAAHERLIYDRLKAKISHRNIDRQGLLIPYLFSVNAQEAEFIENNIGVIRGMGFDLKPFGAASYRVDEVPADLMHINLEDFFAELLSDINGLKVIKLEEILKDKIAMTACKHAVKGGAALSDGEINGLFKMLEGNLGLKCPHGRPICVTFDKKDFEKMFKRIV